MNHQNIIPTNDVAPYLATRLGEDGAMFALYFAAGMQKITAGKVNGAEFEVRVYPNRSFALVVPGTSEVQAISRSMVTVSCSIESASIALTLILLDTLRERAGLAGRDRQKVLLDDLYRALKKSVLGKFDGVHHGAPSFEPIGHNDCLTQSPHPESVAITRLAG